MNRAEMPSDDSQHSQPWRDVDVLLIGESDEECARFFGGECELTDAAARAFEDAFGVRFESTDEFLTFFRDQGCHLESLCAFPSHTSSGSERTRLLRESVPDLATRLQNLQPDVVVTLLKRIEPHVTKSIELAGLVVPLYVLPYPRKSQADAFREGLAAILRSRSRSRRAA